MQYRMKRLASCLLAGVILIGGAGVGTYGAQASGVSSVIATGTTSNGSPAAGFSKMLSQCLIDTDKVAEAQAAEAAAQSEEAAEEQVSENDVPVVASEYADIAIAQVNNYVNVRAEANTDSEVLGKLYNNSAATVLETTDDGWYKINSGSVTGYVKAEYVVTGDEELARRVSTRYATVTTTTLYVRTEPSTESSILTMLGEGDDFVVVDDSMKDTGWVIVTTEEGDGYVSTEYVNLWTDFVKAESKAEEEARLAKEEAERQAAAAAAEAAKKKASRSSKSSSGSSTSTSSSAESSSSYSAPSGSDGQVIPRISILFSGASGSVRLISSVTFSPTIISVSDSTVASAVSTVSMYFPFRRTATRSESSNTSFNLCVMIMMDFPAFRMLRSTANNFSVSCGVKTAVGSSKIRISAPR